MRQTLCALATLILLLAGPDPSRAAKLNTADMIGTWTGTWNDTTLGTSGLVLMIVDHFPEPDGAGLGFSFEFHGPFFGCAEGGPQNAYIFPGGTAESKVTAHKLKANSDDGTFGNYKLKTKGTVFKMKGKDTCDGAGPPSYSAKGKLDGDVFDATFQVKVDGGTATVTLHLSRQPT